MSRLFKRAGLRQRLAGIEGRKQPRISMAHGSSERESDRCCYGNR
jgi:hypothetical protein